MAGRERRDGSDGTRRRGGRGRAGMRCGERRRSGARRGGQGRGAAAEGAAGRGGAATKRGAGRLPSGVGGQQGAAGCGGAMRARRVVAARQRTPFDYVSSLSFAAAAPTGRTCRPEAAAGVAGDGERRRRRRRRRRSCHAANPFSCCCWRRQAAHACHLGCVGGCTPRRRPTVHGSSRLHYSILAPALGSTLYFPETRVVPLQRGDTAPRTLMAAMPLPPVACAQGSGGDWIVSPRCRQAAAASVH